MTWTQQRKLVKSLADQAQAKRCEARRVRGDLKGWLTGYLGSLETMAWMFAMGSYWAAGRSSTTNSGATPRSLLGFINSSLFAWQFLHRQIVVAQPAADHSSTKHQ